MNEHAAPTAFPVVGLALYDMPKAIFKEMRFEGLGLFAKSGGRYGSHRTEVSHA